MSTRPLVGPDGLSEYLGGIPIATLHRWHSRSEHLGPLAHKVGRHLRWDLDEVDEHLRRERDNAGRIASAGAISTRAVTPIDRSKRGRRDSRAVAP